MKIHILGSGIGGLSAAYHLSKNKEHQVIVYERHPESGGQARSSGKDKTEFSEYCWHVVGNSYMYFIDILKNIKYNEHDSTSLWDNFKSIKNYEYVRNNDTNYFEKGDPFISEGNIFSFAKILKKMKKSLTIKDYILLLKIFLISRFFCDERIEKYDKVLWKDFIAKASKELKVWLLNVPSVYLGMDIEKLSTELMLNMFKPRNTIDLQQDCSFFSTEGPINELIFNPWVNFLKKRGVKFHFNCNITNIEVQNRNIEKIYLNNSIVVNTKYDYVINSMDVKNLKNCIYFEENKIYKNKFSQLYNLTKQIQCQILYKLDSEIEMYGESTIITLPDAKWVLMIRLENKLWDGIYKFDGEIMSVGIGVWDNPGICGKTARECNRKELATEVWNQMISIKFLKNEMKLPEKIPKWDIWSSFRLNNKNEMSTYEPKFSNNIGSYQLRPSCKDDCIRNLFHATAYTKTDMNIFSMESAAEAGEKVSQLINYGRVAENKRRYDFGIISNVVRAIDKFLFKFDITHPLEYL
jgi:uncharacterized protein with NAD-binding domain and iron-sulfur cluster